MSDEEKEQGDDTNIASETRLRIDSLVEEYEINLRKQLDEITHKRTRELKKSIVRDHASFAFFSS